MVKTVITHNEIIENTANELVISLYRSHCTETLQRHCYKNGNDRAVIAMLLMISLCDCGLKLSCIQGLTQPIYQSMSLVYKVTGSTIFADNPLKLIYTYDALSYVFNKELKIQSKDHYTNALVKNSTFLLSTCFSNKC